MDDNNTKILKSIVITLIFPIIILLTLVLYIGITKSKQKKNTALNFANHKVEVKIDAKCKINKKVAKEKYILFEMPNCKQELVIPIDKPHNYYIINIQGGHK